MKRRMMKLCDDEEEDDEEEDVEEEDDDDEDDVLLVSLLLSPHNKTSRGSHCSSDQPQAPHSSSQVTAPHRSQLLTGHSSSQVTTPHSSSQVTLSFFLQKMNSLYICCELSDDDSAKILHLEKTPESDSDLGCFQTCGPFALIRFRG